MQMDTVLSDVSDVIVCVWGGGGGGGGYLVRTTQPTSCLVAASWNPALLFW